LGKRRAARGRGTGKKGEKAKKKRGNVIEITLKREGEKREESSGENKNLYVNGGKKAKAERTKTVTEKSLKGRGDSDIFGIFREKSKRVEKKEGSLPRKNGEAFERASRGELQSSERKRRGKVHLLFRPGGKGKVRRGRATVSKMGGELIVNSIKPKKEYGRERSILTVE